MTLRSVAQSERYHLIVTVWESDEHRAFGKPVLAGATGVLTRSGDPLSVLLPDGSRRIYPSIVDPSLAVDLSFGLQPRQASVRMVWHGDDSAPGNFDLRNALAEVSILDEVQGGYSVSPWVSRRVAVVGRVDRFQWGRAYEGVSFSVSGLPVTATGDFYPPGAELDSDRFGDIAGNADRGRARNSLGVLPPLAYAPVGSDMLVPIPVVVDEVSATATPTDLIPRRYHLGTRRITDASTASHQFHQPDPERQGRILYRLATSSYQKAISSGTDDMGEPYFYVSGDFVISCGSNSITFTNASADVTATKTAGLMRVGWQARAAGPSAGGDDDWCVIESADGSSVTLDRNYTGATSANQEASVIPLPADEPMPLYWRPVLGGIEGINGEPLTNPCDVILDWLSMAQVSYPVATGDLEALRSSVDEMPVSWFAPGRGNPWNKALDLLEYLPIRPYLDGGLIRFKWAGPPRDGDIRLELDLDSPTYAYRAEPLEWLTEDPTPAIRIGYNYSAWTGIFRDALQLDGSLAVSDGQRRSCGRVQAAYHDWRPVTSPRTPDAMPSVSLDLDTVETDHGAELASLWVLCGRGFRQIVTRLEADASVRWLEPGDVVRVTQTGVTRESQLWRIESIRLDGQGKCQLLLESIVS